MSQFLPDPILVPSRDLIHVGYRLATLCALPASVQVSRVKLAEAGFYSQGRGDEVNCYSCGARYTGWRGQEDPMDIHRRLSPQCEHVLQKDRELSSGQQFRSDSASQQQLLPPPSGQQSSQTATNTASSSASKKRPLFPRSLLDLGKAVNPAYSDFSKRRETFASWDQTPLAPLIDDLVLSGFFSLQNLQNNSVMSVTCFYCGIRLKNWSITDNVRKEHIRWSPQCKFLRVTLSPAFIQQMSTNLPE